MIYNQNAYYIDASWKYTSRKIHMKLNINISYYVFLCIVSLYIFYSFFEF